MPTGYTEKIESDPGYTFRAYALHCARAFGACIHQRDEGGDEPRHREVCEFETKRVAKTRARLAEVDSMTLEQADVLAAADYASNLAQHQEWDARRRETIRRYVAMRADVAKWTPPTPEHGELGGFMLSQIDMCLESERGWLPPAPTKMGAAEWLAKQRLDAIVDAARAAEELAKEEERCRKANAWIDALVASLPEAP